MFFRKYRDLPLYACAESLFYFVDNMHAPIFVRDVQILFAMYYYLFVGFNILFAKRYEFVRRGPYVQVLSKKCKKIKFSKYSQVWSCSENLDARNIMLQSKFNLDVRSEIYRFFNFKLVLHVGDVIVCLFSCMHAYSLPLSMRQ